MEDNVNKEEIIIKDKKQEVKINKNEQNENQSRTGVEKSKELLQRLLKDLLETKLLNIEKKSNNHIEILNLSLDITKRATNIVIKLNNEIQQKLAKNKTTSLSRNKTISKKRIGNSPHNSISHNKFLSLKSHTPLRPKKSDTQNFLQKTSYIMKKEVPKASNYSEYRKKSRTITVNKERENKKMISIMNKTMDAKKTNVSNISDANDGLEKERKSLGHFKTKLSSNTIFKAGLKNKNDRIHNMNINNHNSKSNSSCKNNNKGIGLEKNIMKNIDNKSKNNIPNTSLSYRKHKNNNIIIEKTSYRGKNPTSDGGESSLHQSNLNERDLLKIKQNNEQNNLSNNISSISSNSKIIYKKLNPKEIKLNNQSKGKGIQTFSSLESSLQKDDPTMNNNDPILISPLSDLDFTVGTPKGSLNQKISKIENTNNFKNSIAKILDEVKEEILFKYLKLNDLISVKNLSKKCHIKVISYIINEIKDKKNEIINIKKSLELKEIPERLNLDNLTLSKGSEKALELLNEMLLNKLFQEDNVPEDDIIFIYKLFLQLINSPITFEIKLTQKEFWDKFRGYINQEGNGKTGDFLSKLIKDKKIDISGNNLYKVYNLIHKDLFKIVPSHYSKLCGTTGLFVFLIKDILDFIGFSNDKKIQKNAYWPYSDIIDSIDIKLSYLKEIKK